jgi:hypothetical protein
MNDDLINILVGILLGCIVGVITGAIIRDEIVHNQAINAGVCYHHPITGKYTWKTNLVEINK